MIDKNGNKKNVNVSLNPDEYAQLMTIAIEEERSLSAICRIILQDYTNDYKKGVYKVQRVN